MHTHRRAQALRHMLDSLHYRAIFTYLVGSSLMEVQISSTLTLICTDIRHHGTSGAGSLHQKGITLSPLLLYYLQQQFTMLANASCELCDQAFLCACRINHSLCTSCVVSPDKHGAWHGLSSNVDSVVLWHSYTVLPARQSGGLHVPPGSSPLVCAAVSCNTIMQARNMVAGLL